MRVDRAGVVFSFVFIVVALLTYLLFSSAFEAWGKFSGYLDRSPDHAEKSIPVVPVVPVVPVREVSERKKSTTVTARVVRVESEIAGESKSVEMPPLQEYQGSSHLEGKSIASAKADRDLLRKLGLFPKMILVKGGKYLMGARDDEHYAKYSETPAHTVQLTDFYISKDVVTIDEYKEFDPEKFKGSGEAPAFLSSLAEAYGYVKWLSDLTGEYYRFPTESEWEYMARAGTDTPFYTGSCIDESQANFNLSKGTVGDCMLGENSGYRRRVNSLFLVTDLDAENPWGIRHALGNLWELTEDCWHINYINAPVDGRAWKDEDEGDCAYRVLRGGSTWQGMNSIRSSSRHKVDIDRFNFAVRIVKDID